ncbi:MAG TPA: hypothetical protein VIK60_01945 [Vicinamibacterales bacterium]
MISIRALAIAAVGIILSGHSLSAQDLSRYRDYALESSLSSVIAASGARASETKTLHERPARIQELEWRAPYGRAGGELTDPVRTVVFAFYDDQLYRVVVRYDRARTEGLTNADIVDSLAVTYGVPLGASARTRGSPQADAPLDTIVLARWEDATSSVTLVRDVYAPEFQLLLTSKPLSARARGAIKEAIRLDAIEAPRRELERLKKEAADASAARDEARTTNKAVFRP